MDKTLQNIKLEAAKNDWEKISNKIKVNWIKTSNFFILELDPRYITSLEQFEDLLILYKKPISLFGLRITKREEGYFSKRHVFVDWIGKEVLFKIQGKLYHSFFYIPTAMILEELKKKYELPDPKLEDKVFAENKDYLFTNGDLPFFNFTKVEKKGMDFCFLSWIFWLFREKLFYANLGAQENPEFIFDQIKEKVDFCRKLLLPTKTDVVFPGSFIYMFRHLNFLKLLPQDCSLESFDPYFPYSDNEIIDSKVLQALFFAYSAIQKSTGFRSYFFSPTMKCMGISSQDDVSTFNSLEEKDKFPFLNLFAGIFETDPDFKYHVITVLLTIARICQKRVNQTFFDGRRDFFDEFDVDKGKYTYLLRYYSSFCEAFLYIFEAQSNFNIRDVDFFSRYKELYGNIYSFDFLEQELNKGKDFNSLLSYPLK